MDDDNRNIGSGGPDPVNGLIDMPTPQHPIIVPTTAAYPFIFM